MQVVVRPAAAADIEARFFGTSSNAQASARIFCGLWMARWQSRA